MIVILILCVLCAIAGFFELAADHEHWILFALMAIGLFGFLLGVLSCSQDCQDLGKFSSVNNVYQCQTLGKRHLGQEK